MATNPLSGIRTYDPMAANKPKDATTTDTSAAAQTQNFLNLLIAQIKNQDPMSPMDASTMTAQMSQLNMVDSMSKMNASMTAMMTQMQSANFLSQASLIGHSPAVAGGDIKYSGSGNVDLAINASAPLQSVIATLTDSNGNLVESVNLGAVPAGMTNFTWAGTDQSGLQMAAGKYTLTLAGKDAAGATNNPSPFVGSPVTSVSKDSSGNPVLNLLNGTALNAADVNEWLN